VIKLWPHQQQTVDMALSAPGLYDMSDPGTGKTAAHLTAYVNRRNTRRLLVVCPKTLIRSAWGNEIRTYFPTLSVTYAEAGNRLEALTSKSDVVVINVDGVKDIASELKYIKREFSDMIVDEVTAYRHHMSLRSKAVRLISRQMQRVFGLSGTPNPNSVTELWHPMLLIDRGKRLGTSFSKFRYAVQTSEQRGPAAQHVKWVDKPMAEEATFGMIKDVSIRHAFEEVMTHVPANHRQIIEFDLSKKTRAHYRQLEDECILALKKAVSPVHAAALRTKLLQVCSGAVYYETGKYEVLDNTRYDLITELVEERDKCVVAFNWTHQRDQLVEHFRKAGISVGVLDGTVSQTQRDEHVDAFQNGPLKVILMHLKTGAHGLTLTAGTTSIFASPVYEADLMKQFIHRIYRGTQNQVTNTIFIRAADTVEKYVYDLLLDKSERMEDFLSMVQASKGGR